MAHLIHLGAMLPSPAQDRSARPSVQLLIPLYNEADTLGELTARLQAVFALPESQEVRYSVLLIDDGSQDGSGPALTALCGRDGRFGCLRLSRNFGHQAALSAGLDHADADVVIVLDGDLQDPPELIPAMLALWRQGADVVYGVRRSRREAWIKRFCYAAFYRVFWAVSGTSIPMDAGDFGLLSRRAYLALRSLPERVKFLRGLRSWVGFHQVPLEYDRHGRHAGSPKYTFLRLYKLATDGLTSFSSLPLRLAQLFALFFLMATAVLPWLISIWRPGDATSILTAMAALFCASMAALFFCLYALGVYVSRIHEESKGRPLYIVSDFIPPQAS